MGARGTKTVPLVEEQGPVQDARGDREIASQGNQDTDSGTGAGSKIKKYTDLSALAAITRTGAVRLVRAEFVVHQYRNTADPMPCCQDLPEEAFLRVEDLTTDEAAKLSIFALSYCWITADHPDPDRYHLADVARILEVYLSCPPEGWWGDGKEKCTWKDKETLQMLEAEGQDLGGQGRPVAVFWDWCALPQDTPKGRRTAGEAALFERGLTSVNMWYAHESTTVLALTTIPAEAARPSYHESGWTTFEWAVAGILTPGPRMLVVDAKARARLEKSGACNDGSAHFFFVQDTMDSARSAPCAPQAFEALIRDKRVTNGADIDNVLIPKYEQTFNEVIREAGAIKLCSCGLTQEVARETLRVAKVHCTRLRELLLSGNSDVNLSMKEVAASCKALVHLDLSDCRAVSGRLSILAKDLKQLEVLALSHTGVRGRCADLAGLQRLRRLDLHCTKLAGDIAGLAGLRQLKVLELCFTDCKGDVAALARLQQLTKLDLANCTGVKGDVAALAGLRQLTTLDLDDTMVAGDIAGLAGLEALELLRFSRTKVCGDADGLAGLAHLRVLNLDGTQVKSSARIGLATRFFLVSASGVR